MRIFRLGSRCNNACIFCAAADAQKMGTEPSVAELNEALDHSPEGETIAFVGGEPTLYDDLPELVRRAKHRRARVVVQTNARRLAYASYAQTLADAGVDALDVSLHGSTDRMHDYHTSVEGSFRQTLRGCVNGVSAGIGVSVTCVVTRSNFRHLPEIVQVSRALGAGALRFQAPRLSGRALAARDRIVAHPELVAPYLRKALSPGRRQGLDVSTGWPGEGTDFVPLVLDAIGLAQAVGPAAGAAQEPLSSRANPGRTEQRGREHRTGSELREILPGLFDPDREHR